jgi:type VI secretion system secreted protein Hcp
MRTRAIDMRKVGLAAVLAILVLLVGVVVNGPAEEVRAQGASADYFLKIEGIEGESIDEAHRGEIDIESWSWGMSNSLKQGRKGVSLQPGNYRFTIEASKATPKLMLACAQGRVIPSATLTGTTGGHTFIKWELKDVIISSYKTTGERASGIPLDEVSIRFTQIIVTYTTQNADGTTSEVRAGWDLAENKKL